MDTNIHPRILSIIHIVTGVLTVVVFLIGSIFIRTFLPFIEEEIYKEEGAGAMWVFELIYTSITAIIIIIVLLVPLPSIIGGIAVLNGQKWGYALLMISGCLQLFSFPLGTALGVYTIWVFVEVGKQKNDKD